MVAQVCLPTAISGAYPFAGSKTARHGRGTHEKRLYTPLTPTTAVGQPLMSWGGVGGVLWWPIGSCVRVRHAGSARRSALLPSAAQGPRGGRLECAPPCRHGRVGDVSDDDPETAGQGLCKIWGGYVGNIICAVTCSMCDGWGAAGAFCDCMTLHDASFGVAITGRHIHQEAIACSICDISHCHSETCHR